jgi:hypothetical protein
MRVVDVFFVRRLPEVPIEKQSVAMQVLLTCKFKHGDKSKHTVQLELVRPDGTRDPMGDIVKDLVGASQYPEAPGGFNIAAQIGIIPKQLGTHYIVVLIDGVEVDTAPFTLLEQKPVASD